LTANAAHFEKTILLDALKLNGFLPLIGAFVAGVAGNPVADAARGIGPARRLAA
jgi:hypothetical protein